MADSAWLRTSSSGTDFLVLPAPLLLLFRDFFFLALEDFFFFGMVDVFVVWYFLYAVVEGACKSMTWSVLG